MNVLSEIDILDSVIMDKSEVFTVQEADIDQVLELIRNGEFCVVSDSLDPDSEIFLCTSAQMITPEKVNFMARFGRGLVCLALTSERVKALGLAPMGNGSEGRLRFTVSVEAREGVTTGISAADRARTISAAVNASGPDIAIVSPGHVHPVEADAGGVLGHPGRAEAAVDLVRLAGLNPSGVFCAIINEEGEAAKLSDVLYLAEIRNLKVISIPNLENFRLTHDRTVKKLRSVPVDSGPWLGWVASYYFNPVNSYEVLALIRLPHEHGKQIPICMRRADYLEDMFGGKSDGLFAVRERMESGGVILIRNCSLMEQLRQRAEGDRRDIACNDKTGDFVLFSQILEDLKIRDRVLPIDTMEITT